MKPDLHIVPPSNTPESERKQISKKERLLDLAARIIRQNAENTAEMFEIMKLED